MATKEEREQYEPYRPPAPQVMPNQTKKSELNFLAPRVVDSAVGAIKGQAEKFAQRQTGISPQQIEQAGIDAVSPAVIRDNEGNPSTNKNVATQNLNNRRGRLELQSSIAYARNNQMGYGNKNADMMNDFDAKNTERREGILADIAQSNKQRAQAHMPIPEGDMEAGMKQIDEVGITEMKKIPGVYKNEDAGRTIYGDSVSAVATPWEHMKVQGVSALDEEGNITANATPYSQSLTPAEEAYWQQNGNFAGFNMEKQVPESSLGGGINYAKEPGGGGQWNFPGTRKQGQGGNWWDKANNPQSYFDDAEKIMKRMPYGSPGDRAKRQSMMAHANGLVDMGNSLHKQSQTQQRTNIMGGEQNLRLDQFGFDVDEAGREQYNKDREYGIDAYNAQKVPAGTFKQGPPLAQYDPDTGYRDNDVAGDVYDSRVMPAISNSAKRAVQKSGQPDLDKLPPEFQKLVADKNSGKITQAEYDMGWQALQAQWEKNPQP